MMDVAKILDLYRKQQKKLAIAESCTGGLISACLTDIPHSSDVFERGYVTYSNAAKMENLNVPEELLHLHGAVSPQVAAAMAKGCLYCSHADISLAVTGIAGPGGGTPAKPIGLVYYGLSWRTKETRTIECHFKGNRKEIREMAKSYALELLAQAL